MIMFWFRNPHHLGLLYFYLQEVELNKKRPLYIKAKEKTAHMIKKLESAK